MDTDYVYPEFANVTDDEFDQLRARYLALVPEEKRSDAAMYGDRTEQIGWMKLEIEEAEGIFVPISAKPGKVRTERLE